MNVRWIAHNLLAHPLLVLVPPLGEWLHDATLPGDEEPPADWSPPPAPEPLSRPLDFAAEWQAVTAPLAAAPCWDDEDEFRPGTYL